MMMIRKAEERGRFKNSWLDARHSFSFGEYHDPDRMGIANLRVINDDRIAPEGGFATHPHQDMEIITYVLSGALEHRDSLGNGSIIRAGDVQRMSAGSGVQHSEFNPSSSTPVKLLQIWLKPNRLGIDPEYEQRHYEDRDKSGKLLLIASPDGRDGSMRTHQDGLLFSSLLDTNTSLAYTLAENRIAYAHIARGNAVINGQALEHGDGAIIQDGGLTLSSENYGEILLFDLPLVHNQ